jgi:hypothetical protein
MHTHDWTPRVQVSVMGKRMGGSTFPLKSLNYYRVLKKKYYIMAKSGNSGLSGAGLPYALDEEGMTRISERP